ncbi:MAG: putative transport system permease protein, partial [Mycobacterium sp.]|nr:putative transport system permease protein [Mycobacterium sp.]
TLTLSVLERRREIGVLRAMGTSRRFTLRMILAEAAAIGIVGGICGLVFGLADQWLYSLVSGDMMNFTVDFRPSPMALVFTVGALAISLLGSLPPARRAARLNIIEAVGVD